MQARGGHSLRPQVNGELSQAIAPERSPTLTPVGYVTLDSCHSRWVFDTERLRYRRVPQGPGLARRMAVAEWNPYHELHIDPDSDSFTVVLNEAGTRMLRSWRHTDVPCPQCGGIGTQELSLDDIAHVEGG